MFRFKCFERSTKLCTYVEFSIMLNYVYFPKLGLIKNFITGNESFNVLS